MRENEEVEGEEEEEEEEEEENDDDDDDDCEIMFLVFVCGDEGVEDRRCADELDRFIKETERARFERSDSVRETGGSGCAESGRLSEEEEEDDDDDESSKTEKMEIKRGQM